MKKTILLIAVLLFSLANAYAQDIDYEEELKEYVTFYNANLGYVPDFALKLFGSERMNTEITFENDTHWFGIVTEKGKIVESHTENLSNPTMNVYTSKDTIDKIGKGELSFEDAVNSEKIIYEPIKISSKVKMGIAKIFLKLFSLF